MRKYNEKGIEGLVDKRGKRKAESEMTEAEKLRAENRILEARNRRLKTENAVLKNSRNSKEGGAERSKTRLSLHLCSENARRRVCNNRDLLHSEPESVLSFGTYCRPACCHPQKTSGISAV